MNSLQMIREIVKTARPPDPINFVIEAIKPLAINNLNIAIKNCKDCEVSQYTGCFKTLTRGNEQASVLVLCDFPTESQKNTNDKFIKVYEHAEEWKIMQKIISAYNINPNSLFFINVVNCFTQSYVSDQYVFRQPNTNEMKNCKVFTDYAFKIVDPIMVIILGNYALNAVKEDVNIMKNRGEWITVKGVRAMPTYSPSMLLQLKEIKDENIVEEYKADFCDDILKAFLWLQEEYPNNNVILKPLEKGD